MNTHRNPGSFRDPDGYVVHDGKKVYRVLSRKAHQSFEAFQKSDLFDSLIQSGQLIGTTLLEEHDPDARDILAFAGNGVAVARHEPIDFISYPSEWTLSMLADAAMLTLTLQESLIQRGLTLKDASAYNLTFRGMEPVFIDVTSIEPADGSGLWFALGQFYRMFYYPLLLAYDRDFDTRGYFLANIDGLNADRIARLFGAARYFRPGLFLDVTLPAWLANRAQRRPAHTAPKGNTAGQLFQIRRLKRNIGAFQKRLKHPSTWVSYTSTNTYTDTSEHQKISYVQRFIDTHHPAVVADFGCNTGVYSRLAAQAGCRVIAIDSDHDSVDTLYRDVHDASLRSRISPLWLELHNPTPAIGFRNKERPAFTERFAADAIVALALMHHLLVSARIPLPMLVEYLASLTSTWLVFEYIAPSDPMFRKLTAFRSESYDWLSEAEVMKTLSSSFTLLERQPLEGGTRVLYTLAKRG